MAKFLEDQFPEYNPPYGEEDEMGGEIDGNDRSRGHHESDAEVRERFRRPETPQAPKERLAVLTVSIDVTVGGYTGQREEWESHTHPYTVSLDGDVVTLGDRSFGSRVISFDRRGLEAALKIMEQYGRSNA